MLEPIIDFQKKMLRDRLRPADARLAFGDRVKGQPLAELQFWSVLIFFCTGVDFLNYVYAFKLISPNKRAPLLKKRCSRATMY